MAFFIFAFTNDKIFSRNDKGGFPESRFNIYTTILLILASASHLISILVFHQGILAYILSIIFLLAAGYSTTFTKPKDQI